MRLEELSKWAVALNSPSATSPYSKSSKKKPFQDLVEKFKQPSDNAKTYARDNAQELSAIRSVEELQIDYTRALSIKRGDLAIIQGEVFRCSPLAAHLSDIPLIVKRLDCVDRRTYDLKVYEVDTFSRFQGHPNIVALYSFWAEKPTNPYTYKTLALLMEEGILGDMLHSVVQNPIRPSNRLCLRYLCDIAKGLIAIHNCNIIHGRVKPSSLYLDAGNNAMLGEFGKVELDSARQTHQLFSKLLIGEAIPHTLVYWAPELLRLEKYGKSVDLWALGVTLYQIVTGRHPFNVEDENAFRDDALTANVDMAPLEDFPRLASIITGLLQVDPAARWNASDVLTWAQYDFAVDIQRVWRGFRARKEFHRVRSAVVLIQAHLRGYLQYVAYWRDREIRRERAAIRMQSAWRGYLCAREYHHARRVIMRCQANVLCRQGRRAYLNYRADVIICQAAVRRFLAIRWFARIKSQRAALEGRLANIQAAIIRYQETADSFKNSFPTGVIPPALRHLSSYEDYELAQAEDTIATLPRLRSSNRQINSLEDQIAELHAGMKDYDQHRTKEAEEDASLQKDLGVKFVEYAPMIEALKRNLKRVADQCSRAMYLPIKIQHPYTYSKWDSVHEPYNVVENVLKEDDSVFRTLTPAVDMTLCSGSVCFVSEIVLYPGDCGPANMEIYSSREPEMWSLVSTHKCTRDPVQTFMLPGEQLCKYIRLKFSNNVRGGNIVSVRQVRIKGLVKE